MTTIQATGTGDQAQTAIDKLAEQHGVTDAVAVPESPEAPQTPFPTSLILTRDQEDNLVKFALEYVDRLETQMGRKIVATDQTMIPDKNTHFGRRDLYTLQYYNHVEYRALTEKDTIYKHSNITASLSQRVTMQMVARANNFYFGTDPWYACNFVGTEDKPLSERVDRHSKWKFDQTRLKDTLMQATEFAFVRGEAVLKTTHQTKERYFKKRGNALHDETGAPVLDSDGNFIFDDAQWVPQMAQVAPPPEMQQQAMAANQPMQPMLQETGRLVLKRDPVIIRPVTPVFKKGLWPVKKRLFHGPDCRLVFFKDFLCPLDAATIHEAELVAHLYDLSAMDVITMFQRQDLKDLGAAESLTAMRKAVEALRGVASQGAEPKSAQNQAKADFGGQSNEGSAENPKAEIAEVYLRYDADEDGIDEEIMLVLDRANRFPLFYDFLDNVTPAGRRPFEVVRGKAVDNVWWGMGAMEYFWPEQEFIDLLVNRKNFRMSAAGRVTFWNPTVTIEGQNNPNLLLNNGKTYRLREGMRKEDALEYVELPPEDGDLFEFLQFFMQLMQLKSGIVNAGDQQASGLPTNDTATGIRNVEKSGQEMFAQWLNGLEPGHAATLKANVCSLYAYMDEPELYRFFDAIDPSQVSDLLSPEEVRDLEFDVSILLTRVRTEQVLQMSAEARALVTEFYTLMPPAIQPIVAAFYRDSLKALGYNNAEAIIQPVPMALVPPTGQPVGGGAPASPVPGGPAPGKGLGDTPTPPTPRPEESPAMI